MNRKLQLQVGGKQFFFNLPKINPRELIAQLGTNLVGLATAGFLVLAPWLPLEQSLKLFYFLSLLMLGEIAFKSIRNRKLVLKDTPMLMAVILFAILNMSMILLPNHKPALISSNFSFNSGLTLMSSVVVFYYLSVNGLKFIKQAFILSAVVGSVASLINPSTAYGWQILLVPALVWSILNAFESRKREWFLLILIMSLGVLSHWFASTDFVELFWSSFLIAGYGLWLYWQKFGRKLNLQITKETIVLIAGATGILLTLLGMARINFDLIGYFDFIVTSYPEVIAYLAKDFIYLLTGGIELTNVPLALQVIQSGGLTGFVSLAVVAVLGGRLILGSNIRSNGLLFIVLVWPLAAIVLSLPITAYLIWWCCLGVVSKRAA